jgi:hypothetical protein
MSVMCSVEGNFQSVAMRFWVGERTSSWLEIVKARFKREAVDGVVIDDAIDGCLLVEVPSDATSGRGRR